MNMVSHTHLINNNWGLAAQLVSVVATISKGQETLKEQIASCKSLLEQVNQPCYIWSYIHTHIRFRELLKVM